MKKKIKRRRIKRKAKRVVFWCVTIFLSRSLHNPFLVLRIISICSTRASTIFISGLGQMLHHIAYTDLNRSDPKFSNCCFTEDSNTLVRE